MTSIFFTLLWSLSALIAQKPALPTPGKTALVLHHSIGRQELALGSPFVVITGDTITVQKFRYYLSNFSVGNAGGADILLPPQYFLVDEADPASKQLQLPVAPDNITSIRFMIGVDSAKNVSGIQEGALDPLKGMFWTWNTGYIAAKLEGTASSSPLAMQAFTFHVGGYRSPYASMRWVTLPVTVRNGEIHLYADINRWFQGKSLLRIAETPVCHSTGALAARIADNYANLFSASPSL